MTHPIPDAALARHIAVVGETGSGKTHDTKVIVERVVAAGYRVCVLDTIKSDWWGITSSASGKSPGLPFKILGGPRGHVPLHSGAGIADDLWTATVSPTTRVGAVFSVRPTKMTEREELVERVSAAMAKAEPKIGATRSMIEAAIAEYEAATERTAISLADKYQDKLARLEADLADEKMMREVQENALNQCCKRRVLLEAQCAAMRGALESYACDGLGKCKTERLKDGTCLIAATSGSCGNAAHDALSPDAGEKVLAVVRAAQEYFDRAMGTPEADELVKALSALEGKP